MPFLGVRQSLLEVVSEIILHRKDSGARSPCLLQGVHLHSAKGVGAIGLRGEIVPTVT